jgi:hypothetical protein
MQLDQATAHDPCGQAYPDNFGLIWTAGILLRMRRPGGADARAAALAL